MIPNTAQLLRSLPIYVYTEHKMIWSSCRFTHRDAYIFDLMNRIAPLTDGRIDLDALAALIGREPMEIALRRHICIREEVALGRPVLGIMMDEL